MNISGVTQTANVLPMHHVQPYTPAPEQLQGQGQEQARGADAINISVAASVQVMDMAQSAFEDAANELIETMAATTGVGQNMDITV